MPTTVLPLKPNAGRQARLEAGAQRTLEAVACTPLLESVVDITCQPCRAVPLFESPP
jgi:hypothetical protein